MDDNKPRPDNVPYIVLESVMLRDERIIRRLWIALLCAVAACLIINGCWLLYVSQYDFADETITVDSKDGGDAYYSNIARDGDIYYGYDKSPQKTPQAEGQ